MIVLRRFLYGLVLALAGGCLVYAVESLRTWWWVVALVIGALVWIGELIVAAFAG